MPDGPAAEIERTSALLPRSHLSGNEISTHHEDLQTTRTVHTKVHLFAVDFEWDPDKNASNMAKHGIDFEDVISLFAKTHFTKESDRGGEKRFVAVGEVNGRILTVVYMIRGDRYRIISARKARKNEQEAYRKAID